MENNLGSILLSLVCGMILGGAFLYALWITVKAGLKSPKAPAIFAASLILRTALLLLGFYIVSMGELSRLIGCSLGFTIVRIAGVRLIRRISV